MKASKVKESPIMRANEVCRLLKIGRNTLYEWCRLGIIPCKRVGRILLFSHRQIYDWLENNKNAGGVN